MGVVSNKIDITDLQLSGGGGGGDLPGRVTALEAETVQLAEGLAIVQTSVRSLDLESVQLAEGLARVQTSVNSGAVPMQTGNKIKFGVDGDGNYGYYKAGADTVTPFLTDGGSGKLHYVDVTVPSETQRLEIGDLDLTEIPEYICFVRNADRAGLVGSSYIVSLKSVGESESSRTTKAFAVDSSSPQYKSVNRTPNVYVNLTQKKIIIETDSTIYIAFGSYYLIYG